MVAGPFRTRIVDDDHEIALRPDPGENPEDLVLHPVAGDDDGDYHGSIEEAITGEIPGIDVRALALV